jgi:CRP-like cAMP-binding protein
MFVNMGDSSPHRDKTAPENAAQAILHNLARQISLNQEEETFFLSKIERRSVSRKEFLLTSGSTCLHQWYVISGCFKVFYLDRHGTEHIVKLAPEDWWTVDLESFSMQTPAFYSIQALEPSEVFQINKTDHDLLYEQVPKFERFLRIMFQNSYIMLQHRMTQNLFSTAEEKFYHFTQKYPGLDQRISQKEIASYLGITPEFLSMLRRKWAKAPVS